MTIEQWTSKPIDIKNRIDGIKNEMEKGGFFLTIRSGSTITPGGQKLTHKFICMESSSGIQPLSIGSEIYFPVTNSPNGFPAEPKDIEWINELAIPILLREAAEKGIIPKNKPEVVFSMLLATKMRLEGKEEIVIRKTLFDISEKNGQ